MQIARAALSSLTTLLLAAATAAQEPGCTATITAIPTTLSQSGVHCFEGDLATSSTHLIGAAITVSASNVVVDLRGFTLRGPARADSNVSGVQSSNLHHNITVRNGTIRDFAQGVNLTYGFINESAAFTVERIRAVGNHNVGIRATAPSAGSGHHVVRDNVVLDTGGSEIVSPRCTAIEVAGTGSLVAGNVISGLTACDNGGQRAGIELRSCHGCSVERNQILSDAVVPNSEGILVFDSDTTVVDNRITRFDRGVFFSGVAGAVGRYRDNLTVACTVPFTGGSNAGNNQ